MNRNHSAALSGIALGLTLSLTLLSNPAVAAQPETKSGTAPAAAPAAAPSRGEMLYEVRCGTCHASEVHWRAKKLATNPERLRKEVLRWKNNVAQEWSDDDVNEVARYLDAAFYQFGKPAPAADRPAATPQMK